MAISNVVILLIGLHGSGKSTFTKAVTEAEVEISSSGGVTETTRTCKGYPIGYKGKQVTIIDTPGLADKNTHEQNLEILDQIASELGEMGEEQVSGVIYFHNIQKLRLGGVDMANIRILKAICGEPFPHMAFVTSHWDRIRREHEAQYDAANHDLEIERRRLLPKSPRIFKFLNDGKCHERVLDYFVKADTAAPSPQLRFAEELKRYQYEKNPKKAVRKTGASKQMAAEAEKEYDIHFGGILLAFREFFLGIKEWRLG